MTRRSRVLGLVVVVLFIFVNVAGMVYAAVHRELLHAALHAVLALLGELVVWRLRLTERQVATY